MNMSSITSSLNAFIANLMAEAKVYYISGIKLSRLKPTAENSVLVNITWFTVILILICMSLNYRCTLNLTLYMDLDSLNHLILNALACSCAWLFALIFCNSLIILLIALYLLHIAYAVPVTFSSLLMLINWFLFIFMDITIEYMRFKSNIKLYCH